MIKPLQLLLLASLLANTSAVSHQVVTKINYLDNQILKRPFYKNIDQYFFNNNANVVKATALANGTYTSNPAIIFYWKDFADSWSEFQANYQTLNLTVAMDIAFNWYNIKWSSSKLDVKVATINSTNSNWITIHQVDEITTKAGRGDATHGRLDYSCWFSQTGTVEIRFRLVSWASNNYDNYYYSITTKNVQAKTTFDYNKTIKEKLNTVFNNKTLFLPSDYSTSLQEEHNQAKAKLEIDEMFKVSLNEYYEPWKQYISSYTYTNTNEVKFEIKFPSPDDETKQEKWPFSVTTKFTLSQDYWDKNFQDRLKIIPGKVIDPTNPNGGLITDQAFEWNGKNIYGTTAAIEFDGALNGSETMKINNTPIQVIDNHFSFQMTDNQEHKTNEYNVLIEKHDLEDFNNIISKYEVNYTIRQNIPQLDLKWYAWDPENNPNQKNLISPQLPNGDPNPNYDPEVNSTTGTKTELMWIKQSAENVFPLDPLDQDGKIITDNNYEQGYLAQGAVSGMGIQQLFNDPWIKNISRVKVDPETLKPSGIRETIVSDDKGSYFSNSGTYLYIINDQKAITANKLIIIGQKWNEKYAKFLDVINNPKLAVPFWSTNQGYHLKSYLINYKQFNSIDIKNLDFEAVSSYWKEYVSDVHNQHIIPGDDVDNNIDLQLLNLDTIKINSSDKKQIESIITTKIATELRKYQLQIELDYQIQDLPNKIEQLLTYSDNNSVIVNIKIVATNTSTIARNWTEIKVRNSKNYNPNEAFNLAKIKFPIRRYNFCNETVDHLTIWIIKDIEQVLKPKGLVIDIDYQILNLDEENLKEFLRQSQENNMAELKLIIQAIDNSDKAENSTTLTLINDPDGEIAPPEPPAPETKPEPSKPNQTWFNTNQNLTFLSIIVSIVISILTIIIFLKNRLRKGIGGKKKKIVGNEKKAKKAKIKE